MPIASDNLSPEITIKQYQEDDAQGTPRWWLEPKDQVHASVWSVTQEILLNLTVRRRMNYFFATLYNDVGSAFTASQNVNLYYNKTALDGNALANGRMTANILQNVVDTATALIAKNKPKPQFVTDGAKDYGTKVRGKKLTKYTEGLFDKLKIYEITQRVFQDACIYGTGALKIFEVDGELKAEWVFIEEVLVDDLEGMHQDPQQLHQRKFVQRDILLNQFPEYEEEIKACSAVAGSVGTYSTADIIPVIESWHKPSGPKAKDGKHSICIENCTLFFEDYKKDYFPILLFRWANQTLGFWGRGICHEIWKLQVEVDTLLRLVQQSMRLVGGPTLAVESGSNISEDHITSNRVAKVIEYTVTPPQYMIPPTTQPEIFNHINFLITKMYEIPGVSESNATGQKPAGVNSGVAIREVNDIASGRFEIIGQHYEALHLDIARIMVDLSADLAKSGKSPNILTKDKRGASRLDFKECQVDINDMELQLFPVSGLPSTPAGRLDQLMDYAQAGYLSKEQVMDIVDFPDLEDTVSLETAALHLTQEILSNIKEGKEYIEPGPYLDLNLAYRMVCLEIDRSQLQKVDEADIDRLRDWADQCQDLISASQQQIQPQEMQQNAGTMSQVGAAPTMPAQQMPMQPQG